MSPQEERLILELHSRWGNRWSRIARKLPGRTDNEIKNYWRTHMRKTAQERKKKILASSTSPSNSSSSSSSDNSTSACSSSSSSPSPQQPPPPPPSLTGSSTSPSSSSSSLPQLPDNSTTSASEAPTSESVTAGFREVDDEAFKGHFMDQIWDEIAMTDAIAELGFEECKVVEACDDVSCSAAMPSPMWENCSSYFLWKMDDEDLDHF
ncbi:hypothetical protein Cni_G18011 [Canna indica]|uniref:Uncharacterized protein n=1 Tax=Canna indica TaxID=4628 RepID=A0AAQ3KI26_9LILI|nr:hypothetical protein Cni_G18011 [Canna indica]